MEVPHCSVCFNDFNETEHLPLIIHCGHTFCKHCIEGFEKRLGALSCPLCRDKDYRQISVLPTNVMLLHMISKSQPNQKVCNPCAKQYQRWYM